jgi:hypothetical protein
MRSDSDIQRDVEEELRSDPDLDATDIGVAVKDGVVTLTGFVRSYAGTFDAETAAKRVASVVEWQTTPRRGGGRIPTLRAPPPLSRPGCPSPRSISAPSSRTAG